jgi:hypothetical protein
MPQRTITNAQLRAAHAAARALIALPTPSGRLAGALGSAMLALELAQSRLNDESILRDAQGRPVPLLDPNGNEIGHKVVDPPAYNVRLTELAREAQPVDVPLVRASELEQVPGVTGAHLADLLPLLEDDVPDGPAPSTPTLTV